LNWRKSEEPKDDLTDTASSVASLNSCLALDTVEIYRPSMLKPLNGKSKDDDGAKRVLRPRRSAKGHADIPPLLPRPSVPTSNYQIVWSPKNLVSEIDIIRERMKLIVHLASTPGYILPMKGSLLNDRDVFWVRIIRGADSKGNLLVVPYDAVWPKSLKKIDPARLNDCNPKLFLTVNIDLIVLPCELEEKILIALHDGTELNEYCGDGLWMWTEDEYDAYCRCLRHFKSISNPFTKVAQIIGTKDRSDIVEMHWMVRPGIANFPSDLNCSKCQCLSRALIVCKRYFACKTLVCRSCFDNLHSAQKEVSSLEPSKSMEKFDRVRHSSHWTCVDCKTSGAKGK